MTEVETRRSKAIQTNTKMKRVMDAWLGTTVDDVFREWKVTVERLQREKRRSQSLELIERKRYQEEKDQLLLLAQREVSRDIRDVWRFVLTYCMNSNQMRILLCTFSFNHGPDIGTTLMTDHIGFIVRLASQLSTSLHWR